MKAFVTGATGLLGSNLVRLLLAQGHSVKALARSAEKANRILGDTAAEIVVGDMQDVAAFADEMVGCDVLFHCAAYFREYYNRGEHWPILQKINVDGVTQILEAAERAGVKKAIHVSSSGVIANSESHPGDESAPFNPLAKENLYFKSKILAEEAVQAFLKTHQMPVVLILPGWMMGPSDAAPTDAGQVVLDLLHGDLPGMIDGSNSMVDARDVAQGMINAVKQGKNGERYIVGGALHSLVDVGRTVHQLTGVRVPGWTIPYPLALAVAWASETMAKLRGTETVMTVSGIRTLHKGMRLNSQKAQRELGVTFRPLAETLADEIEWYAQNEYLKKPVNVSRTAVPTAA